MSVAAQSPFCGNKRVYFESEAEAENQVVGVCSTGKRSRFVSSPAAGGRCTPLSERQAYFVSASTVAALRGLFPEMDEQTISNVLCECGDNIDNAIRRLNELKLCGGGAAAASEPQADAASQQAAGPDATPASPPQEQQQQPAGPALELNQWVDTVLSQMAEAKDVDDARHRASSVLQALAHAVAESLGTTRKDEEIAQLQGQANELAKDNHILKRAVAIQNGRLQELAARESEVAGLRQLCAQYQEKMHALELSNYSLALHLKQATCSGDPAAQHSQRHPDVF